MGLEHRHIDVKSISTDSLLSDTAKWIITDLEGLDTLVNLGWKNCAQVYAFICRYKTPQDESLDSHALVYGLHVQARDSTGYIVGVSCASL